MIPFFLILSMTFNFVGGSYQHASLRADAQSSINLYPELDESGSGKSKAQLVGTPGLQTFATLGASPVRGIWIGDDRMFAVAGSKFYEVFSNGTASLRGDVGNDGKPVEIFPNGNQLFITSGGMLYVDSGSGPGLVTFPGSTGTAYLDATAFTLTWVSGDKFDATMLGHAITGVGIVSVVETDELLRFTPGGGPLISGTGPWAIAGGSVTAAAGTVLDGYGIISIPETRQFNISGLYDFTQWDPLDFAMKEGYPDHIRRPLAHHQDLWLFGKQTSEVWVDTGRTTTDASGNLIPLFPFERRPGMVLNIGAVSRDAIDRLSTAIALLAGDEKGAPIAVLIEGYTPGRISTPVLEKIWAGYSTAGDAVSYSYEENGHWFWVLSFPTADATWCYDLTAKTWHQRGYYSGGVLHRDKGAFHGYVWGSHFVGAWDSGKIYRTSLDINTHDGAPILRQRAAPHLSLENKRSYFSQFILDLQAGQIDNPQFTLEWSNDGGSTWSSSRTVSVGLTGQFGARAIWRRLGTGRDRVFRVTSTAAMRHVWIDAFVEAQAGLH